MKYSYKAHIKISKYIQLCSILQKLLLLLKKKKSNSMLSQRNSERTFDFEGKISTVKAYNNYFDLRSVLVILYFQTPGENMYTELQLTQ